MRKEYKTKAIVGYTGFVGSNIYGSADFDHAYNTKNIESAYGTKPDLLVYAGLRAEKYLANNAPGKDMQLILQAEENIRRIDPEKLVLISTIDVFREPVGVDETSEIITEGLHAYGYNRYMLEEWVRKVYPDALIVRLPGLYGKNIKKNFIYDFINIIPFMLKEDKYCELSAKEPLLKAYYERQDNGFYRSTVPDRDRDHVKELFRSLGFSALNFTDSRSTYQFYDLSRLWDDIGIALDNDIKLLHTATEPVSAGEVYTYLTGREFENYLPGAPAQYDYRTVYAGHFGNKGLYLEGKKEVLKKIEVFVKNA